jgi:hypothetical protein
MKGWLEKTYNHLQWMLKMGVECSKLLERGYWKCVLNDVEERGIEKIQHSWILHGGTRGAFLCAAFSACTTSADRTRLLAENREREADADMWRSVIGCLDFYHINTLNSIISLQIFFYIPKFMIIFVFK